MPIVESIIFQSASVHLLLVPGDAIKIKERQEYFGALELLRRLHFFTTLTKSEESLIKLLETTILATEQREVLSKVYIIH